MVGHDDGEVVSAGKAAEQGAETNEFGAPSGHVRAVGALALKFSTVVGGHGVEDDEADFVPGQKHGDLVLEDVILGFEVWRDGAVDGIERRARPWVDGLQHRVGGEHLGETTGGQRGFG